MIRWPIPTLMCVGGKFFAFRAAELRHGANDTLRCVALVTPTANDNSFFGGRA